MLFKKNNLNIILVLILVVIAISFLSIVVFRPSTKEGFTVENNINDIKSSLTDIHQSMASGYPDMSKFALKSEINPPSVCRVSDAVDKDSYVAKTDESRLKDLVKCPEPDTSKYILKSLVEPQSCPSCPTIDETKYVLKSSLPPTQKCPDCKCPQVKVSAGLCQKCPPPPKCPEPKPCPVVECPPPKPCPPQQECPACPPKEACPPKICPPCPIPETPAPTGTGANIVTIYRTVTVDQNGKELSVSNSLTTPSPTTTASSSSQSKKYTSYNEVLTDMYGSNPTPRPSSGSGLATPTPTTNIGSASTSTGGSLNEQSNAGLLSYFQFSKPTDAPFVQSYKVTNPTTSNKTKSCQPNAFNSEFKQFGIYGDNTSKHYSLN